MTHKTNRILRDHLIRSRVDGDDPTAWSYIDNNSFTETVGGTASDGDYVVTINPVGGTAIPITFNRAAAEDNTGIATGIVTETNTLLAVAGADSFDKTVLKTYIKSVSSAAAVVTFIAQPNAPKFTITDSAPGTGTLTLNLDETFPITWNTLGYDGRWGLKTTIQIVVIPVDASNVPLDPNSASCTLSIRRMIDRQDISPYTTVEAGVGNAAAASYNIGDVYNIEGSGGRFGIAMNTITGTITGLDHFEIWGREITT